MSTLRQLGEREVIRRLAPKLPTRPGVILGLGDDCAIVAETETHDQLLTTDALIEGRHFLPESTPELIGRKAAARAISDIASMGGESTHLLVNLVAHPNTQIERIERVYDGLCEICRLHNIAVIGGDTTSGTQLELHIFLTGRVPAGHALRRDGAKSGDLICVTGTLGGSIRAKHFEFTPRIEEARWLREGRWATAMIDVSDGLATDLRHLCHASNVSAILDATRIPYSREITELASTRTPLDHALFDGEDYELLFTLPEARLRDFERDWKKQFPQLSATLLGRIQSGPPAIQIIDALGLTTDLADGGYEHFR